MKNENQNHLKILDKYFDLMKMNGSVVIFQMANQSGLLKLFVNEQNGLTKSDLQKRFSFQDRPVEIFLNVLVDLGLIVSKDNDRFFASPLLALMGDVYQNLGGEYWSYLPKFLATGQPLVKMDNPEVAQKEYLRQIQSLDWMMKPSAIYLATLLVKLGVSENAAILDLGAGSGVWSRALLSQNPKMVATINDLPSILDLTKKYVSDDKLNSQVNYWPENFFNDQWPKTDSNQDGKFDVILIGNVIHLFNESEVLKLFNLASKHLAKNGKLVVADIMPVNDEDFLMSHLYEMGLALRTEKGRIYNQNLLSNLCTQVGLTSQFYKLDVSPKIMGAIVATKFEK